jgi:hypothetical protein
MIAPLERGCETRCADEHEPLREREVLVEKPIPLKTPRIERQNGFLGRVPDPLNNLGPERFLPVAGLVSDRNRTHHHTPDMGEEVFVQPVWDGARAAEVKLKIVH